MGLSEEEALQPFSKKRAFKLPDSSTANSARDPAPDDHDREEARAGS